MLLLHFFVFFQVLQKSCTFSRKNKKMNRSYYPFYELCVLQLVGWFRYVFAPLTKQRGRQKKGIGGAASREKHTTRHSGRASPRHDGMRGMITPEHDTTLAGRRPMLCDRTAGRRPIWLNRTDAVVSTVGVIVQPV